MAGTGAKEIVTGEASNEFVFAVVGHAGSGTSAAAETLKNLIIETKLNDSAFDVTLLKARDVIQDWATAKGQPMPDMSKRSLENVRQLQDYGDEMRSELKKDGKSDFAAVAGGLIRKIQAYRANRTGVDFVAGQKIEPDGTPRAYVLDSIRHPAEVELLRHVYGEAFVLIGVVCEENKRASRMMNKFDCGHTAAKEFMERDADDQEKHGQHVADAFHLADFFVDNTVDRTLENKASNPAWKVPDDLSRLIKLITHIEIIRPKFGETAMYHAFTAQMQSACLSKQVGAAVVDMKGNVVATGANEVPKAGGGVYGESYEPDEIDARCAFHVERESGEYVCRNTQGQNRIVDALLESIPELSRVSSERKKSLRAELKRSPIGKLLEFSRSVHAEMDALLSAARKGVSLVGSSLFVTTFPCHYCARHIVAAGICEVQYIEPYPKSQALSLHEDSIATEKTKWKSPSQGGTQVLFRPFSGVAPRLYKRAFLKNRELKDPQTGVFSIQAPEWTSPWHLPKTSYIEIEAKLGLEGAGNE